jgi:hypothetical protein
LLAARRDAHLAGAHECWLHRRSASVARMNIALRRKTRPIANHVWDRGRTALTNGRFASRLP